VAAAGRAGPPEAGEGTGPAPDPDPDGG
jgi:hypothetical protein